MSLGFCALSTAFSFTPTTLNIKENLRRMNILAETSVMNVLKSYSELSTQGRLHCLSIGLIPIEKCM